MKTCDICNRHARLLMKIGDDELNSMMVCESCAKEVATSVAFDKLGQKEFTLGEPTSVIRNGTIVTQYRDLSGRYRLVKTVNLVGELIVTDNSGFQFAVKKGDAESYSKCWAAFVMKQVSFHDFRLIQQVLS